MLTKSLSMSSNRALSSAAGFLPFLEEPETKLKVYALQKIHEVVDLYWHEITEYLSEIEKLYEDEKFSHRDLAGIICSKIYYHLEEYSEALKYALGAGSYFKILEKSQYTNTILAKGIDEYIEQRTEFYNFHSKRKQEDNANSGVVETSMDIDTEPAVDGQLENIVEKMLWLCIKEGDEKQALGISFDAKRIDFVEYIISNSKRPINIIQYCLKNVQQLIPQKCFRNEVMDLIVNLLSRFPPEQFNDEYSLLCLCLYHQWNIDGVANLLVDLLFKDEKSTLLAYQVAFDLVDLENQSFLNELLENPKLRKSKSISSVLYLKTNVDETYDIGKGSEIKNYCECNPPTNSNSNEMKINVTGVDECSSSMKSSPNSREGFNMDIISSSELFTRQMDRDGKLRLLRWVLCGKGSIELNVQFLHRNNHSDLILLNHIKNSVDPKNSITHNAIVIAHALVQAGTSCDIFLRNNLDWLSKAVNWAKFNATASLGVIHKGQTKDSKKILSTYLPNADTVARSPYSEGGALYALGLLHANHVSRKIKNYLLEQLRSSANDEPLQHGACLGLGLLCLGTNDDELYEILKGVMYMDSAVVGEAAAYAIGLVMLASASHKVINELLTYAHDTQHEKIIRACSVAMSMVMYRKEEEADAIIDQLTMDKDALVRYGGMYTIGMAYCGTAKNSALRQLLHVSVSDVCDDVRRAAVIAVGFVLCNMPKQVPKILNLLAHSYNAHVRYGTAIALGISCAGTGFADAVSLLLPLASDVADFVRQGAFIGLGLVLQQVTSSMSDNVKKVREMLIKVIADKHEDVIARFGAILACGLIDAGGRNTTATFFSKAGNLRREAAVGFCLFSQIWNWYPLIHCVSLAFQPNALIGVNKNLRIPLNFAVKCKAPQELFAYPTPTPLEKKIEKRETVTAVLSTVAKRQAMKTNQKTNKCEIATDSLLAKNTEDTVDMKETVKVDLGGTTSIISDGKPSRPMEDRTMDMKLENGQSDYNCNLNDVKNSYDLVNPFRVLNQQEKYIEFYTKSRYIPLSNNRKSGFILLQDTRPSDPEDLLQGSKPKSKEIEERPPPEPFEWNG